MSMSVSSYRTPYSIERSSFHIDKKDNSSKEGIDKSKKDVYINGQVELTRSELSLITELKIIDQAVRAHENAHVAAGGQYVTSGAQLGYTMGPDGKKYATSGEVSIDTSELKDPHATIFKMNIVRSAALAPVDPSTQDIRVATAATVKISEAGAEIVRLQQETNLKKYKPQEDKESTIDIVA